MILLLPGNAKALMDNIRPDSTAYGWLLTPRRTMTQTGLFGLPYAIDNECFTLGDGFDPDRYRRALHRIADVHGTQNCLFATAPDVVCDAPATISRLATWTNEMREIGFPVALVGQDGLENFLIPWSSFDALFIGGSTEWKLSKVVASLLQEAERKGKWTHIGRVNSVQRASRLRFAPGSVDGTAWAKHPKKYAAQWQRWLDGGKAQQLHLW